MESEQQEVGEWQLDAWEVDPWDDYEVDEEREWERVGWLEDLLVPLDSVTKSD